MDKPDQKEVARKASRAQLIIYIVMFIFIALPFILVWLSGAVRF